MTQSSHVALVVTNSPPSAGDIRDAGSIPGLGRSPGEGHGNPLHDSCLENPVDREPWQATVHRVTKSWKWLKRLSTHARVTSPQLTSITGYSLHAESKNIQMNWFTKQKQTQTKAYHYQRKNTEWSGKLVVWDWQIRTETFKMDNQQGPTIQHRELWLIISNYLNEKRI